MRLNLFGFLLLLGSPAGYGLKILMYQLALSNTHMPYSGAIADTLIDRGHIVDKIVLVYHNGVKSNGTKRLRNVYRLELEDNPFMKTDHLQDPFRYTHFDRRDPRSIKTRLELCKGIMEDDAFISKLKAEKYDSFLVGPFDFCSFALNHVLRIPSLNVYSVLAQDSIVSYRLGLPSLPSYVPQVFDGRVQPFGKSFWQRLQSFLYLADFEFNELGLGVDEYKYLQQRFPNFPSITELFKQVHYIFLNTNEILDIPQPTFSRTRYLGGIAMKPNDGKLTEEVEKILSIPSQGTVVFSFGSLIQTPSVPLHLKFDLLRAFKQFPQFNFIWKVHEEDEVRLHMQNFTNVYPINWLPQIPLLNDKRVKLFITHMGMNSYLEVSQAGKPVIGIPFFVDQFYNMGCVLDKGIGVFLDKRNITIDSMTNALNQVLYDEKYKRNAEELASMLRDRPANVKEDLIKAIEFSAKHPRLHEFLQLESVDMPTWKLYSVDVIAFLGVCSFVSVWFVVFVLKHLLSLVFVRKGKSKHD